MKSTLLQSRTRGFSLVELVVVMLVILIMISLIVPSSRILSSAELEQGVELVYSKISLARQTAIKQNEPIEIRFYNYDDPLIPGGEKQFRALQILSHEIDRDTDESIAIPISKIEKFPGNIIVINNPKYSTLVTAPELKGSETGEVPETDDATYFSFFFLPNGSADLPDEEPGSWFLTIAENNGSNGEGELPKNYIVIQVEPFTGTIRRIQPEAG